MASGQEIRQRLRCKRIEILRHSIEPLLACSDDVIGLSQGRWLERQRGEDPWWRSLCRVAIRLHPTLKP